MWDEDVGLTFVFSDKLLKLRDKYWLTGGTEGFEPAPQPVDIANYSNPPKSYAHIYAHTSAKCPVIRPKSIRFSRQRAGGRETGRRSCSANTPSCQSPAKPLPPVRTGDDKTFSEAPQQVRGRGRSRRMVGDSLHISLELPLRPLVTNSGCRTDHCRELGPNIRKQSRTR
jgi:hypothetical protein